MIGAAKDALFEGLEKRLLAALSCKLSVTECPDLWKRSATRWYMLAQQVTSRLKPLAFVNRAFSIAWNKVEF